MCVYRLVFHIGGAIGLISDNLILGWFMQVEEGLGFNVLDLILPFGEEMRGSVHEFPQLLGRGIFVNLVEVNLSTNKELLRQHNVSKTRNSI